MRDSDQSHQSTDPGKSGLEATWWGESSGLRCGRVQGTVESGGLKLEISSAGSVWLWLNREGTGLIWGEQDRFFLKPGMYAMTGGGRAGDWSCVRHCGFHTLELVVISRDWLMQRMGSRPELLQSGLSKWLTSGSPVAFCGLMGVWERDLCDALTKASADTGPSRLLAEARVLEWATVRLYRQGCEDGELRQTTDERDPVKRALQLLRGRLDQPLDLALLAREVGVSPHHLSRKVGAETGLTLMRHLRRLRIERACEALDSKRMNVTEVALDVGYQSLSHFAKAFREETGRSPSDWLAGRDG